MEINIIDLIHSTWNAKEVDNQHISVSYRVVGRGNNPKAFILPKRILLDKEFIEGLSMYIGDGKLSSDLGHLEFTSKDEDLLNFMCNFFKKSFNVREEDFMFRKQAFQISGKVLRILFGKIAEEVYNFDFHTVPEMRRAFLRGLFAAEGGIGISTKENYIAYIAFHLSYTKEERLARLVQTLLNLEGISSKQISRENKGERYIRITGWENYYKCWKIGMFDLCQRKKKKFLEKIKRTNFFFKLKKEFAERLLNSKGISHRQIAMQLNILPSTLCRLNKGKTDYINKKDFISLIKINGVSIEEAKKNILWVRVNKLTIIRDVSLIDWII